MRASIAGFFASPEFTWSWPNSFSALILDSQFEIETDGDFNDESSAGHDPSWRPIPTCYFAKVWLAEAFLIGGRSRNPSEIADNPDDIVDRAIGENG